MKARTISHLDGELVFRIPAEWSQEATEEGGGCYWNDAADEHGTLWLTLLTMKKAEDNAAINLRAWLEANKPQGEVLEGPRFLDNGNAIVLTRTQLEEDGDAYNNLGWTIANSPGSPWLRLAIFSFVYRAGAEAHPVVKTELEFVHSEIPQVIFSSLPPPEGDEAEAGESRVVALEAGELEAIADRARQGEAFVRERARVDPGRVPSYDDMDRAFAAWLEAKAKKPSDEVVPEILGAFFGQRCVDDLGLQWVRVIDEWGETLAVAATQDAVRLFPASSISKRVKSRDATPFLAATHAFVVEKLEARGH